MEVKARLKNARFAAQKARPVANLVRGKDINDAIRILTFMDKKPAAMILKLVESAVANADNKKVIDVDNLYIKHISVDQGPALKRFRPRAKGSASGIKKRMSHVNLILDER